MAMRHPLPLNVNLTVALSNRFSDGPLALHRINGAINEDSRINPAERKVDPRITFNTHLAKYELFGDCVSKYFFAYKGTICAQKLLKR